MSFGRSTAQNNDVEMTLEDEELTPLNMGMVHEFPGRPNSAPNSFTASLVPGVTSSTPDQPNNFQSVEEYAALMGITLDTNGVHGPSADQSNGFFSQASQSQQPSSAELAKIQANAQYLESLCRPRDQNNPNPTSMTLPAGIGSGLGAASTLFGAPNASNTPFHNDAEYNSSGMSNTNGFGMNSNTGLYGLHQNDAKVNPVGLPVIPPTTPNMMNGLLHPTQTYVAPQRWLHQHELGSHTLSPEVLNAMLKNNAHAHQRYAAMKEEEKAALLKEERSRERNRDHSRKSRLRKKEFVENLKQEVQQLHLYQELCEQCSDLIAMISIEIPGYIFAFKSTGYVRLLGYDSEIVIGRSSFLDHVHPEDMMQVKRHFEMLSGPGDFTLFTFRIKLANGGYTEAETSARVGGRGIICCTRLSHFKMEKIK